MTKIIDLDAILPEDKKVKLGGKVYTLPPDLPAEVFLKMTSLAESGASESEITAAMYDELLELFRYKEPDLEKLPISLSQIVNAVGLIYSTASADDGEAPARPPRPKRSGGATSSAQRKTSSRR